MWSKITITSLVVAIVVALATYATTQTLAGPQLTAGPGSYDINGLPLIMDLDGDSSLTADTDDRLDIALGGSDVLHYSSGSFTFQQATTISVTSGNLTFNQPVITGNMVVGTSTLDSAKTLLISRDFTDTGNVSQVLVEGQITSSSGSDIRHVEINPVGAISDNAGAITHITSLSVSEPIISFTGGGSVTNASTIYVRDAPTEATNNYGLFVDSGISRFDGDGTTVLELPEDNTDPTGGGGAAIGRIPIIINGVTRYLAYY